MPEATPRADVKANYEGLRGKLLDPSLRNRLLNAKPSRVVGVEIHGESADGVYQALVVDRKRLAFAGPPEGTGALFDLPPDPTDLRLNTRETPKRLEARLLATWRQAEAQMEEQGLNTLYLALGALHWHEDDAAETPLVAPLLLVPVRLERTAGADFRLAYDETDLGPNLSLLAKARDAFGLVLPEPALADEAFRPSAYAAAVAEAVARKPRWRVEPDRIGLGFFSFTKFVLYEDLDERRWPEDAPPTRHPDLAAALGPGYPPDESPFGEDTFLDAVRSPESSREVFNADSSQLLALVEAARGTSMVIEGPPGTGKSQTIANLIAEAVYAGKRVLFVSEKLAALDVVYRRLEEARLADACLQLHSQKANRRAFYDEIERVWNLRGRLQPATEQLARMREVRETLNATVEALNAPLPERGLSPRAAIGEWVGLPAADADDLAARHAFEPMRGWSLGDLNRRLPAVRNLQRKVAALGVPAEHPFFGCAVPYVDPTLRLELAGALDGAAATLAQAQAAARSLAETLRVPAPGNAADVAVLEACVEIAVAAPELDGVALDQVARGGESWTRGEATVRALVADLRRLREIHQSRDVQALPQAWTADLIPIRAAYEASAESWLRFLSGDYRRASKTLRAYLTPEAPSDPEEQRDLVRDLVEAQGLRSRVEAADALARTLFGVQWQGETSDPDRLERLLDWTLGLVRAVETRRVPEGLLDFFTGQPASPDLSVRAHEVAETMGAALAAVRRAEGLVRFQREVDLEQEPLAEVEARLARWREGQSRLGEMAEYNGLREEALSEGLASTVELADRWPLAAERLVDSFRRGWLEGVLAEAMAARPPLRRFDRTRQGALIEEFRALDEASLAYNRAQVAHAHLQSVAGVGAEFGNAAELKRQCSLRRGHRPIRWAMSAMPELIQRIKPVFLMSPLSVPAFLPPRKDLFDVVIFDEASQVKPEDALSAIARGRQTIVVGDSKQMPPTSFFERLGQAEDEPDDEGLGDAAVGKLESVLALFASSATSESRRRWLRWHYRSLHPALIQPSNHLFYEDRLVVPPSPVYATAEGRAGLGVVFHYDPLAAYERSGARKNPAQARAVARAVLEHLRLRAGESLLVVAFSKAQQEAIEDELERARRENPGAFAAFAALHPHEPLTVKNLETVQGDERDVTFVSVGYGPDAEGRLTMNFGPINAEGGERRLNVLMTRARRRCEVFSSLRAADVVLGEEARFGVTALKRFLEFAETGGMEMPASAGEKIEAPFETTVAQTLESHGYQVDLGVGSLGFRIDLAVRHPERPGLYALGIECDGASYESARSARDRDKIRQGVLESRGWRLYRVWSVDWWRDPEAETRRLLAAIDAAVEGFTPEETAQTAPLPPEAPTLHLYQDDAPAAEATNRYQAWSETFDPAGANVMGRAIAAIVAHEGPIHKDLLVKRLRAALGLKSRAQGPFDAGLLNAVMAGGVASRQGFYYAPGDVPVVPRDRSDLDPDERRAEWVAPEEIEAAILQVVDRAYGIAREDLPRGVRDVLGFAAASAKMSERVLALADLMVAEARLTEEGGTLQVVRSSGR